jgi:transcriptional regulator
MYIPDYYKNENRDEIEAFLKSNAFGILVNRVNGTRGNAEPSKAKLWATHIPMEFEQRHDGKQVLIAHVSKENPQWKGFDSGEEVLAIFSGPHAYVSSSWYDFEGVPTWNYSAIHIYGKVRVLDETQTIASLKILVDKYEAGRENAVRVEDLSRKTMMMARAIVAFEIEITDIEAKKKHSQNRDAKNYESVISHLEKSGNADAVAIAADMKKNPR